MSQLCSVKSLYSTSKRPQLKLILAGVFNKSGLNVPVSELYEKLLKKLKEQGAIKFENSENIRYEVYKPSVEQMREDILTQATTSMEKAGKDNDFINSFVELVKSNFMSDAGVVTEDTTNSGEDPEPPVIEGTELVNEDARTSAKLSEIINSFYGTAFGAAEDRQEQFRVDVVKTAIIDVENGVKINNNNDLNNSISVYKEKQFAKIVRYLKSVNPELTYSEEMYDENRDLSKDFLPVMNMFYNLIAKQENNGDKATEEWKKTLEDKPSLYLEALGAYINIQYFDTLISDALGKSINITESAYRNHEMGVTWNKYAFAKGNEHKVKHWGTDEAKDALSNIGKYSKLVISTIPIISTVDGRFTHKYVTIQTFSDSITSLFGKVMYSDLTKYKPIRRILNRFHKNPRVAAMELFKLIATDKTMQLALLQGSGFNRLNLDILTSVYDAAFNTDNPKSIVNIETSAMKRNFVVDTYSILDSIIGVVDRTMEANYLQTDYSNGSYTTSIKKKHQTRRTAFSTINIINSATLTRSEVGRAKLFEQYPMTFQTNNFNKFDIKIGNEKFTVNASDGILSTKGIVITAQNGSRFNDIFSGNSTEIDLTSSVTTARILRGSNLNADEQLFRDVLKFIDDFLKLDLLSEQGLSVLMQYKALVGNSTGNFIKPILESAIRVASVNNFYRIFDTKLASGEYSSLSQFEDFMFDSYFNVNKAAKITKKDIRDVYYKNREGIYVLNAIQEHEEWIDQLAEAESILSGEASKSTTKDLSRNSIGNYRTSFLGGNIEYYLTKFRDTAIENEAAKRAPDAIAPSFFVKNEGFIARTLINTDVRARNGIVKNVRDMRSPELFYDAIVHNFYGSYLSESSKHNDISGCFVIQPTTYSDKVTFLNYAIRGNKKIDAPGKSYNGKTLANLNPDEIVDLYYDTIGESYKNLYNNVLNDLRTVLAQETDILGNPTADAKKMTIAQVAAKLEGMQESVLLQLAQKAGVPLQLDTHYRVNKNGTVKFNELLYYYSKYLYKDTNSLRQRLDEERVKFANQLLDSGVAFYTNYYDDTTDKTEVAKLNPIGKILNSDLFTDEQRNALYKDWVNNGKLIIAKVNGQEVKPGTVIPLDAKVELNPVLDKYFYLDSLLANNLRLPLTGTEVAHPDKAYLNVKNELARVGITPETNPELFDETGKFIGSYMGLAMSSNPNINAAFMNIAQKIEAIAQGTQLKRNVIIPATLQYMSQGTLTGIPASVKVAVIRDTKAKVWNFRGDNKKIDAHDGSAWINPFISLLENKSLQDQEVGVDKKPIWHGYDSKLMSATLLKFATFTMTAERMRESLNSDISLYDLFKQMTDIKWKVTDADGTERWTNSRGLEFDLVKSKGFKSTRSNNGYNIRFVDDIIQDKPLFYKDGLDDKQIVDFGKDEKGYYTIEADVYPNGNPTEAGVYTKIYHKFDADSNHYKFSEQDIIPEGLSDINSLFQLYNVMGGIYAESLIGDSLQYSDAASEVVVNYMNSVMIRVNDNTSNLSQSTYYQPLKEMMIGYAANNSAVKVGAYNINNSDAWKGKTALSYMELSTDGLGIQMDADHDIDEAEMTEFSQVISALEAGGRLHSVAKEVYQTLGRLAVAASSLEMDAVDKFINQIQAGDNNNPNEFKRNLLHLKNGIYDVIGRAIINNYSPRDGRYDLAEPIINEIKKRFKNFDDHSLADLKIAFSDSNLYSTVVSTFMSNINKKSIKRKYPGSGCVMVPGYDIIKIFKIGDNKYQFDDILNLALDANSSENFYPEYNGANGVSRADYNRGLVNAFLQRFQEEEYNRAFGNRHAFIPTEIVDVGVMENGKFTLLYTQNLDDIKDYYRFKLDDAFVLGQVKAATGRDLAITDLVFARNVTRPRNLAPARITWEQDGRYYNIFDTEPVMNAFGYSINGVLEKPVVDRAAIQRVFDELAQGRYADRPITNLVNAPAELVMSNLYASKFATSGKTIASIKAKGEDAFKVRRLPRIEARHWDLAFTSGNNKNTYITFSDLKSNDSTGFEPVKRAWSYIKVKDDGDVVATTKDGQELFKVGKRVLRQDLEYNKETKKFQNRFDHKEVPKENLIVGNDGVYEYKEFISRYEVAEKVKKPNGPEKVVSYTVYKINKNTIADTFASTAREDISRDVNEQIASILGKIYTNGTFTGLRIRPSLLRGSAIQMDSVLRHLQTKVPASEANLIAGTLQYLEGAHDNKENFFDISQKVVNGLKYDNFLLNYYNSRAAANYAAFTKSLRFTASRIPAQTLQSFMQMEAVGWTQSSKNICYVSHWQTYLQGSDYDIDKAYIMGLEFDDNGMYIGWSNLFDYSSAETLEASEELPVPTPNVKVRLSKSGFDISNGVQQIWNAVLEGSKAAEIRAYAKLIKILDDKALSSKDLYVTFNDSVVNLKREGAENPFVYEVVNNLNLHYNTDLRADKLEAALKNAVSSRIQRIVQDPRNMDQAYTSIDGGMDVMREAANKSPKGEQIYSMSLMNPLSKFVMQEQNMTGKGVISISAVGEKVFFTLSNYWNEGLRSGDPVWQRRLKFQKVFRRIQGRASNNTVTVTRSTLGNVNFEGVEQFRDQFINAARIDSQLRAEYSITERDIQEQNDKWLKYRDALQAALRDTPEYVDINISSILSAATDNAKELILNKINAGTDLARCHLYLIMMGFSLDDIISFMISPAVNMVSELASANMFDEYMYKVSVTDAINALRGNIPVEKFFSGTIFSKDEDTGNKYIPVQTKAFKKLQKLVDILSQTHTESKFVKPKEYERLKDAGKIVSSEIVDNKKDGSPSKYRITINKTYISKRQNPDGSVQVTYKLGELIRDFMHDKLAGNITGSLLDFVDDKGRSFNRITNNIAALSDFIDRTVGKIQTTALNTVKETILANPYLTTEEVVELKESAINDFWQDLDEFEEIYDLASETTTLGSYLASNQGLPTDSAGLINFLTRLQAGLESRQKHFGILSSAQIIDAMTSGKDNFNPLLAKLQENNPALTRAEIIEGLAAANQYDLVNNFSIERWLQDDKYKDAVATYYNVIKGTWNLYDIVTKLPHFKAIFDLLRTSVEIYKNISKKSNLLWMITKDLFGNNMVDSLKLDKLIDYVDDLLILQWIEKSSFTFPIFEGEEIFDASIARTKVANNSLIALNTQENRASFKLRFETLLESLVAQKGSGEYKYDDLVSEDGKLVKTTKTITEDNAFINNLVSDFAMDGHIFWKLDLNMQNINSTTFNRKKYQECLDGFIKLSKYKLNGIPLTDWFMIYNFVVNKNKWGSDRLTSLFAPFIAAVGDNSVIKQYFTEAGELDWDNIAELTGASDLEELHYNKQDALYKIAPIISETQESVAKDNRDRMIIEHSQGVRVVKSLVNGVYMPESLLPFFDSSSSDEVKVQKLRDFSNYVMLQTPFASKQQSIQTSLASNDARLIIHALKQLMEEGQLEIFKNC